jgi:hypothetical protein
LAQSLLVVLDLLRGVLVALMTVLERRIDVLELDVPGRTLSRYFISCVLPVRG